jgi:prepilin signal peptidase PulO-like enzyme (type II secretory pathway)
MQESKIYSIPNRFRQVENMHIVLWLMKDACWAMNFRTLGTIMIVPTLAVAILITWQTRHIHSELLHNLVVTLWITANCTWMIGEFFGWDDHLLGDYGLRQLTIIPFTIGLLILLYYYVFLARNVSYQEKMNIRTNETIEQELNR